MGYRGWIEDNCVWKIAISQQDESDAKKTQKIGLNKHNNSSSDKMLCEYRKGTEGLTLVGVIRAPVRQEKAVFQECL